MNIAFDFNPVIKTKYSGFYTFGVKLLEAFNQLPGEARFQLFYNKRFQQEAEEAVASFNPDNFRLRPTMFKINQLKSLWKRCPFPKIELFTGPVDVYHSFHNMMPPTRGVPRVLTVHDLRRYRLPGFYNDTPEIFVNAVNSADHIIAVSDSTRNDIIDIFHVNPGKVSTVHLACSPDFAPPTEQQKAAVIHEFFSQRGLPASPFMLTISATDHRKNIPRTIAAFHRAKNSIPKLKLVVAGFLPKDDNELATIRKYASEDPDIILAGPVPDLCALMSAAEALLFLSLYEGFGIPILESFAYGVPVLTSNCSSMPEVGGDAALYADPESIDSIADAIPALFSEQRLNLVNSGLRRVKDFSWDKAARETLAIYKQLRQSTSVSS